MPDRIVDAGKLIAQYAWAACIVAGITLFFVPQSMLGLGVLYPEFRLTLLVIFLFALMVTIYQLGQVVRGRVSQELARRREADQKRAELDQRQERLHRLTDAEKEVLRPFIAEANRTQWLDWMDGVVVGLELEKVIHRALPMAREGMATPFNMQHWAYAYLTAHRELVGLPAKPVIDTIEDWGSEY
jgi:Na+-transporting methylmalonyl-CoA/oxaloacetate decarboxylase gamma subunit